LLYIVLALVATRLVIVFRYYLRYRSLVKEGLTFTNGFTMVADLKALGAHMKEEPTYVSMSQACKNSLKVAQLPPITGMCFMFGLPTLLVTDPHYLKDLYVNKNQHITKYQKFKGLFVNMLSESLFFDHTTDPQYVAKRKEMSGAFFK
jgi:hypothetical protein